MNDDPLYVPLERGESFGRNFLIVLGIHVAVLGAVWLVDKLWKKPVEQIVWLDGGGEIGAAAGAAPGPVAESSGGRETAPPPEPVEPVKPPPVIEEPPPKPAVPPPEIPSELTEKKPTPAPTPKPTPKPENKPKPDPTPRPKAPTPEPKKEVKATPKPAPPKAAAAVAKVAPPKAAAKPAAVAAPKSTGTQESTGASGSATNPGKTGGPGAPGGAAIAALQETYLGKVGKQFTITGEPRKPISSAGLESREYLTSIRFRIARDGKVLAATVTKPCGNPLVDKWVTETIEIFRSTIQPPPELLENGVFEMTMLYEYTLY